jgi:hypothetical protein
MYSALLGERVVFDGPTEKWIGWPEPPSGRSRRNQQLVEKSIRVVTYTKSATGYAFVVGATPLPAPLSRGAE